MIKGPILQVGLTKFQFSDYHRCCFYSHFSTSILLLWISMYFFTIEKTRSRALTP